MAKNSLTALLLLFVPLSVSAQTFTNDEYGYSVEIDDSFQLTQNNHATYFRSDDNDSVVIIKNWPGLDDDAARDYLQQGIFKPLLIAN
jgi:L-asparaginase/Glu-tRNA(Gln) amidotransferase subunit D